MNSTGLLFGGGRGDETAAVSTGSYLAGLLLPRDRNKTLPCLAGAEPVAGAQHAAVQRLQFFLSDSTWDLEKINTRRLELLLAGPATAPHPGGVLVIDDSGDRKAGSATAHVGKQYLGSVGKIDRGVVTVTTCWADERVYYPVHACPYTPAHHYPGGRTDPAFRTKLQIAADLARQARDVGVVFRAIAADCAYGDQDNFRHELHQANLPYVSRSSPAAAPGPTEPMPTPPSTPPSGWTGTAPTAPAPGPRWSRPSATGTPRPGGPPTPGWAGGGPTETSAWSWPPPTRPHCPRSPPGTWPPTCPGPAARARRTAPNRPPIWQRSSGSTASGTGSSRTTSRSRTNSGGPTSRSAPTPRSAATRPWSPARSPSAGTPGSPDLSLVSARRERGSRRAGVCGPQAGKTISPALRLKLTLCPSTGRLQPYVSLQAA
ncbi:IS701 family transposase [Streptacidiphilus rugosus]|uniref:IS701 family transposase n=1 Tax=Streptacidiphilus rugosus TaxID=405783 RepID=UPI000A074793|nr:transposase [Streptacidiphilus rugosus]